MKLVRCNKCKDEYYICEELDKIGFPIGGEQCECGKTDYTVIDNNIQVKYNTYVKKADDMETITEDMRHTMAMLKDEILELVKTYLDPWLK